MANSAFAVAGAISKWLSSFPRFPTEHPSNPNQRIERSSGTNAHALSAGRIAALASNSSSSSCERTYCSRTSNLLNIRLHIVYLYKFLISCCTETEARGSLAPQSGTNTDIGLVAISRRWRNSTPPECSAPSPTVPHLLPTPEGRRRQERQLPSG